MLLPNLNLAGEGAGFMFKIFVAVGHLSFLTRHARSLKDKRHITQSLTQKLRNRGFSVTESGFQEEPKRGGLGYVTVGSSMAQVTKALDDAERLFVGDFEVLEMKREIFDYSGESVGTPTEDEDLKFGL